ncbi:MAG: rhomboid family intramembrane serine protease [Flavobacteriaceae bacterium]|nr:rhomboid family intramembrane serine protease [Flavobacteriaceae bacterium]
MNTQKLTYQYKTADVVVKLIVINVVIFLALRLISFFMQVQPQEITQWLVLPEDLGSLITQPWSLVTYSFLHYGFGHIFWNMLVLYMFGRFVLNLFSETRFLSIYLLGAIVGGLLYVIAYNVFPVFSNTTGFLLGASASVRAIMIFIAAYMPQSQVRLIFFNVKLWQIGVFVILMDIIQLTSGNNAGGMLAHLGGALFGYVYARQLLKGKDIGAWFERFLNNLADAFKPRKAKPFKKVHRNQATQSRSRRSKVKEDKSDHQQKVDAILDKIGKSGYDSLTKAEKDFLFKAGKDN